MPTWTPIPGYEAYEADERGRLRKADTGYMPQKSGRKYVLWIKGTIVRLTPEEILALVATAEPNPVKVVEPKPQCIPSRSQLHQSLRADLARNYLKAKDLARNQGKTIAQAREAFLFGYNSGAHYPSILAELGPTSWQSLEGWSVRFLGSARVSHPHRQQMVKPEYPAVIPEKVAEEPAPAPQLESEPDTKTRRQPYAHHHTTRERMRDWLAPENVLHYMIPGLPGISKRIRPGIGPEYCETEVRDEEAQNRAAVGLGLGHYHRHRAVHPRARRYRSGQGQGHP
jgi:hypothetical protein